MPDSAHRAASPIWPTDLSALIPEPYAAYAPLVADALQFFLQQLSTERLIKLLGEQLPRWRSRSWSTHGSC